ncbi:MAG: hypothetical protein JWP25_9015 [Bradyrhizobium sp.]|nr:hypothetical protein [Bradyrhizobium sp.]
MITPTTLSAVALDLGTFAAAGLWLTRALKRRARIRRRLAETCAAAAQRNRLARIPEPTDSLAGALAAMRAGAISDASVKHAQRQLISPFGFDRSAA